MVRQFILATTILLLSCVSLSLAQSAPIRFVDGAGKTLAQVEVVEQSGGLYVPIQTLREAFDPGMKQQYSSLTKRLTLNLKERQLHLRIGSRSISVDSDEISPPLSHPPLIIEGKLMFPLNFFTGFLPKIYDFNVTYDSVIQTVHITEKTASLPSLTSTMTTEGPAKFLVILDPGHGGTDTGYRGSTQVVEKDIVLDLVKKIKEVAHQNQVDVLLTRDADLERTPKERTGIAQNNYGKLFLSLHCNASFSERAAGIHLYVSNSLIRSQLTRPSTDPNETSQHDVTISALSQEDFLTQSQQFATMLRTELETLSPTPIPITEIPLVTLSAVYMPAVLIEIGYLSNKSDEARITDPDHLASTATAVVQAIQTYIAESNKAKETTDDR